MTFEELKQTLAEKTENEKLDIILSELWRRNGINDEARQINLFIGIIIRGKNTFINNIKTVFGDEIGLHPVDDHFTYNFSVIVDRQDINEGTSVVFKLKKGRMQNPPETLAADSATLQIIDVSNKTQSERIEMIYELFPDEELRNKYLLILKEKTDAVRKFMEENKAYKESLEDWINTNDKAEKTVSEIAGISTRIEDFNAEFEAIADKFYNKIKPDNEELAGEMEALSGEIRALSDTYNTLNNDLNSIKERLARLGKTSDECDEIINILRSPDFEYVKKHIEAFKSRLKEVSVGDNEKAEEERLDTITISDIKSRLKYQYSDDKLFGFVTALRTSQIIALCGDPGTGKTTFAREMSKALGAKLHMIDVQNNWTDRSDILGFYNPTNNTYLSTPFLEALFDAKADEEHLHIICLDEMNLARVEYYFATFLSMLQLPAQERIIRLLPHDVEVSAVKQDTENKDDPEAPIGSLSFYRSFVLPSNVRFVGTMNIDDTAQPLSPKVIDRCFFINFTETGAEEEEPTGTAETQADNTACYYPAECFAEITGYDENIWDIDAFKNVRDWVRPKPRLVYYTNCMYNAYKELYDEEDRLFRTFDLIICGKVLPTIVTTKGIPELKERFPLAEALINRGKSRSSSHDTFENDWSYWE